MTTGLRRTSALVAVVAVLVGACSASTTPVPSAAPPASAPAASVAAPSSGSSSAPASAAPAAAVPTVPTGFTELDSALGSSQPDSGKTVSIQVQWTQGELTNFESSLADFQKATGITVQVDSVPTSHETVLKSRIEGGAPPDIAQLAQPTGILAYGAEGKVIDLATFMDPAKLKTNYPATIGLYTAGSHVWAIPYKADVKSTVWYPIKAFAAAGYTVPKTWDDLIALSDKIAASGTNPWCISAGGPGDATGWQITDWVEEVVLKTKGLQYYNDWISHKVTFEDPGIKDAFDKYVGKIFFTPNYVYGGPQAIINTDQKTPMDPMFNQDLAAPKCWMQKIPTWYGPDFFPDQRASGQPSKYILGTDVGIFPFPTIDPSQANVEGSADAMFMLADRPEVRAVEEFLGTPQGLQRWIEAGSAISPNSTTPASWYAGAYKLQVANTVLSTASGVGFDASDSMPAAVGAGTFWTKAVEWVNNGGKDTDAILKAIDDSWPA
ncbi:MAG: ABC transporter substrate-binding protein, partial [Candidatus Limnocylindrales bacterium]